MTADIDLIPPDEVTWKDIAYYIITTPKVFILFMIMILFICVFVGEIIVGVLWFQADHVQYCSDVIAANDLFNASFVGVGC